MASSEAGYTAHDEASGWSMLPHSLGVVLAVGLASAQGFTVTSQPVQGGATAPSAADVNGDGAVDLVVPTFGGVQIYFGDGAGGFAPTPSAAVSALFCLSAAVADGDGDGRLDVWLLDPFGLTFAPADGAGGFGPLRSLGPATGQFAIGDLDNDGDPDLVKAIAGTGVVSMLNDGTANFGTPVTIAAIPSAFAAYSVRLGDIDVDGDVDVVVSGIIGGFYAVLGDGFGAFAAPIFVPTPGITGAPTLADFDGDGAVDFAFGTGGSTSPPPNAAQVWRNDGTGGFQFASMVPVADVRNFTAADMNGDGHVDLVANTANSIVVLTGDGACGFTAPAIAAVVSGSVSRAALADIDHDGRMDILATALSSAVVMRNDTPSPVGTAEFGFGTPACGGRIGIAGTVRPAVGANDFRVQCTNAPVSTVGLFAMGTQVVGGWDPLGLGLTFHLGVALPVAVAPSDPSGAASAALPIPNAPWLVGLTVHVQTFWVGDPGLGNTCSTAAYELASSRGLTITVQP